MKNTANIIKEYNFKILIIEDKFQDLKPVFENLLECGNLYKLNKANNNSGVILEELDGNVNKAVEVKKRNLSLRR